MTQRSADHSSTRVAVTLIVNGEKRPLDLDARVTLFEETVTDAVQRPVTIHRDRPRSALARVNLRKS